MELDPVIGCFSPQNVLHSSGHCYIAVFVRRRSDSLTHHLLNQGIPPALRDPTPQPNPLPTKPYSSSNPLNTKPTSPTKPTTPNSPCSLQTSKTKPSSYPSPIAVNSSKPFLPLSSKQPQPNPLIPSPFSPYPNPALTPPLPLSAKA